MKKIRENTERSAIEVELRRETGESGEDAGNLLETWGDSG
jgi:hypothetical protein